MLGSIGVIPPRIHLTDGIGWPDALQNTLYAEPGNTSTCVVPLIPRPPAETTIKGISP